MNIIEDGTAQTLTSRMGTGGGNVPLVMTYTEADESDQRESNGCRFSERTINRRQEYDNVSESVRPTFRTLCRNSEREVRVMAIDRAAFNQGQNAQYNFSVDESGVAQTLVAKGPGAVAVFWNGDQVCSTLTSSNAGGGQRMPDKENFNCVIQDSVVRRLTPLECCRLQGMPDWWCDDVPHKDAPEYKMWGNGMALPNVLFVFEGVRRVLLNRYISQLLEAEE